MEVSLCAISSCSPTTSVISPRFRCVRLLRREFLGSCHDLRPPGIRSRRQCKKLGFPFHFPARSFVVSSSLDSSQFSAFFVAVAAVSAAAAVFVVIISNSRRKTHAQGMQVSGKLNHPLLRYMRSMMNSLFADETVLAVDSAGKITTDKRLNIVEEMSNSNVFQEDTVAEMPSNEIKLVNGAAPASQLPSSQMVASVSGETLLTTESRVFSLPSTALMQSDTDVYNSYTLDSRSELHLEGRGHGIVLDTLTVEAKPYEVPFPEGDIHREVSESAPRDSDILDKSSSDLTHNNSQREELHTFYEAPMEKVNGFGALSHGSSLLFKDSAEDGRQLPRSQISHHTDERLLEGGRPVTYHKGTFQRKQDKRKREDSSEDRRKGSLNRQNRSFSSHSLELEEKSMDGNHVKDKFSAYNILLRHGRLKDCIETLEEMESTGLLDMQNIYHARFFKSCKNQKAVREAFRFTKLIPNPTLSTFNMLMSVCASSQDLEGAFEVLQLVQEAGFKVDCKLYTTLISSCARTGKVDQMFKVFHEMVNAEVEPNVHTYGALIDGCAKAGQVAKAFGAYGIMQSKNVKPDRVVFNALITACGESGAVDRAFDILAEMRSEIQPIDPDHITIGALMKACISSGQFDRAREVYKMIDKYDIKGTPDVYTIAVNSCSQNGDWEFACSIYDDMIQRGVAPDEMFISALIDVAGHAGKLDAAFEIRDVAREKGINSGVISYSSLMGACSNAKDWHKALQLYEDIKINNLKPTVSMMNALVTALCNSGQLQKAVEILFEMKRHGLRPNTITYSILLVAAEKEDDLELGQKLLSQAKKDVVVPNRVMCRCVIGMCLRRYQKACSLGEPVLPHNLGLPQIDSKWTSLALAVYREGIVAGVVPSVEELSQVLGCLKLPHDRSLRNKLIENLGVRVARSKVSTLCSLIDGFGEYDPRAFSLLEEAASLGIVPVVSLKRSPIVVDVSNLPIHAAEVYILTVLRGLKHRLAAGVKLPNLSIILPTEDTRIKTPSGEKSIKLAGRISQAVAAMLRRLGLSYLGNESHDKIRVNGGGVKMWLRPKLVSSFGGKHPDLSLSQKRLGKGINFQQRNIRMGDLSLDD